MNGRVRDERGIALVIAISAIMVIGGLLVGVATAAVLEHRQAQGTGDWGQAFAVSEHGVNEAVADWDPGAWNSLAALDSAMMNGVPSLGSGSFAGKIRRLNDQLYLLEMTGNGSRRTARQQLGALIRLRTISMDIEAALTTRGDVRIGGSGASGVDGMDHIPPGWSACSVGPPKAGIRVPDADDLTFVGTCSGGSCVTGAPRVDEDPGLNDSTFFNYGDTNWDELVSMATLTLSGSNYQNMWPSYDVAGGCNTGDDHNWGDPDNPSASCGSYFPIIYSPGDLVVNTGVGQGVLLVDGDLAGAGNFTFYGIVIVRGTFTTVGTGAHFNGGLMAANVELDDLAIGGNSQVSYSSCAIARAKLAAAPGALLRSRAWFQMYRPTP